MKIPALNNSINFKGAAININAFSDVHGNLNLADNAYSTLIKNDAFEHEEKGKVNYLINGGDWFISGGKKGYLTSPEKPLMSFQKDMYNKFIGCIKEKFPNTKTLFITGNHELDGGEDLFLKEVDGINSTVIMSNLDLENSKIDKNLINDRKIVNSTIDFIQDDKNPNLKHPVLNLGISPVNMEFYSGKLDKIKMIDNSETTQVNLTPSYYQKTMNSVRKQIDDFKKKNPNGVVILTCHTGANFADYCAAMGGIDVVFDGHEHKDEIRQIGDTKIIALSQNFNKIANTKIILDDSGKIKDIKVKELRPNQNEYEKGELGFYFDKLFEKDTKKKYSLKSKDKNIDKLDTVNIRSQNNNLANFVTDSVLSEIKKIDDSVQIFALNSSSFRSGFDLKKGMNVSPFEVSACLNGLNYNMADILISELDGSELLYSIMDNLLLNEKNPEKNSIIQYSGLIIDKTGLLNAYKNNSKDLYQYVTLKESGEKIMPDKTYKIANPKKYFIKTKNEKIKAEETNAKPLNANVCDLFKKHFEENPIIEFTPDVRLY